MTLRRFTLSAAAMLALLGGCDQQPTPQASAPPPPPPVSVAKPVVREIVEVDEFIGRFEAVEQVELRARVSGYLSSVEFKDGTIVKAGDPLFTLDKRTYEAELARAEAQLRSIQTRLDFARADLARAEQLGRGIATERTIDERRQAFQGAQADLAAAQAAVDAARIDLSFTEIRAPIDGRIGRKLVTEGNLVRANDTVLTTIVSIDPIHFYFDVDERTYLDYVRRGKEGSRPSAREVMIDVRVALMDEKQPAHEGHMDFIDNRIDAGSGTMRGRAIIDNAKQLLTPGLFGRIHIPGTKPYRAVMIPDEAIVADQDRRIVWTVAADGTIAPKPIRPGSRHEGYRIVREGLTGDETIIVAGVQRVRGGRVTPELVQLPPRR